MWDLVEMNQFQFRLALNIVFLLNFVILLFMLELMLRFENIVPLKFCLILSLVFVRRKYDSNTPLRLFCCHVG